MGNAGTLVIEIGLNRDEHIYEVCPDRDEFNREAIRKSVADLIAQLPSEVIRSFVHSTSHDTGIKYNDYNRND